MGKVVTLGEILLRYSTLVGQRLDDTPQLTVHYGGSEANVSIGLSGLGHETTLFSAVPNNPLGVGAIKNLKKYGIDVSQIYYEGERLGSYFVEVGSGARATSVVYDRNHSSFADISYPLWEEPNLFKEVDLFHVSGITLALSEKLVEITINLILLAKKQGVKISFDSNYRSKLWSNEAAAKVYHQLLPLVDYFSASKLDAIYLLGIQENKHLTDPQEELIYYYKAMQQLYPNITVFYSTVREILSTNDNRLMGNLWSENQLYCSKEYPIPYIVDRIGGGDSFAAGLLHGLLTHDNPQHGIEFATGMSALKHTYSGDSLFVSEEEVEQFIQSESSKVNR